MGSSWDESQWTAAMNHLTKTRVNPVAEPPRVCKSPDSNILINGINRVFRGRWLDETHCNQRRPFAHLLVNEARKVCTNLRMAA
jgi:hypothetical protein